MSITIRAATSADYPGIEVVWRQADRAHYEALPWIFAPPAVPARSRAAIAALLDHPDHRLFVALDGGDVVGCVHVSVRESQPPMVPKRFAVIEAVAVQEANRGGGIGRLLMLAAQRWAREQEAAEIWLNVWSFNVAAIRLYETLGYETLSQRMRLELDD